MARRFRHARLESRTARLKLAINKKPYTGPAPARGVTLLYRRNKGNGSWVVKVAAGDGASHWTKAFAEADDYAEAKGDTVLTFFQAQDRARELARGSGEPESDATAPVTVDRALTDYEADLRGCAGREEAALPIRQHPRHSAPIMVMAPRCAPICPRPRTTEGTAPGVVFSGVNFFRPGRRHGSSVGHRRRASRQR